MILINAVLLCLESCAHCFLTQLMFWLLYGYIFGYTFLVYIISVLFIFFLVRATWDLASVLFLVFISMWNYFSWTYRWTRISGNHFQFHCPSSVELNMALNGGLYSELLGLFAPSADLLSFDSTHGGFSPCPGDSMLRTYSLLFALTPLPRPLPFPRPLHFSW